MTALKHHRYVIAYVLFIALSALMRTSVALSSGQSNQPIEVCYTKSEQFTAQNEDEFLNSFWGDYLTQLFNRQGENYAFALRELPYARCQIETTNNQSNISIVLQRIYTSERAKAFLLAPLYKSSTIVYYKKSLHPNGLISPMTNKPAEAVHDLLGLRICGFAGFSYRHYYENGMPPYWSPKLIRDTTSGNRFYQALSLVRAERCDVVDIPTMIFANPNIDAAAFEDIGCYHPRKTTSHTVGVLIKRSINGSSSLANKFHAASVEMYQSEQTREILAAHLTDIEFPDALPANIKRCLFEGIHAITETSEPLLPFEDSEL